ncbi:hypothetical protein SLA2020_411350 [Shorea laevis]
MAEVVVMEARSSDHKPLLVTFSKKQYGRGGQKKAFKFEVSWTNDEECSDRIKTAWSQLVIGENALVRPNETG